MAKNTLLITIRQPKAPQSADKAHTDCGQCAERQMIAMQRKKKRSGEKSLFFSDFSLRGLWKHRKDDHELCS